MPDDVYNSDGDDSDDDYDDGGDVDDVDNDDCCCCCYCYQESTIKGMNCRYKNFTITLS